MGDTVKITLSLPVRGNLARQAIESAVETLARVDFAYLAENPDTPPPLRSGVRYRREKNGSTPENWQSVPEILESGYADCEDLSAWQIAFLRSKGTRAVPVAAPVIGRPGCWHIMVRVRIAGNHWAITDISKEMGM